MPPRVGIKGIEASSSICKVEKACVADRDNRYSKQDTADASEGGRAMRARNSSEGEGSYESPSFVASARN